MHDHANFFLLTIVQGLCDKEVGGNSLGEDAGLARRSCKAALAVEMG